MSIATRPAPTRRLRAGVVAAALWLFVAGCAVWAVVRILGLERGFPAVQLMAFTPYVAAGAPVALGAALAQRRWVAAGVAALATLAFAVAVLPRTVPDATAAHGPRLRVMSVNLLAGAADPGRVVDLVRRHRVDLLAVQEFTPEAGPALASAGLSALLPQRVEYPEPGTTGSALYSRHPLRDDGVRTHASGFTQAKGTVTVPGAAPIEVESVHPCAPGAPETTDWTARDLAAQPPATPDGPVRILIGDFNATLDHLALRRLLATGYRSAADVRGAGLTPSWPYDEKWWVPGVTIDHVLADRRVGVTGYAVYPLPGSDHRAVFAELTLP